MNLPRTEQILYELLDRVKRDKIISFNDLTLEERRIADELANRKLLMKHVTRCNTFYTYGVNGVQHEM
jgi:hypothetical protein